ncbi:MAG TPA: SusD/RagB family nutrient-binding outer membrane lipoprotein, partial [Flavisolibacter sp.]|nr:SusD/RagB family nutrient-binding outer membrane lipoprotein [Flavisolibacter sp.]
MKRCNKYLLILLFFTSLVSCKKYFDINADPASPQNADLASILPPVLANSIFHNAVEGVNAAVLSQHFTGTGQDFHAGNPGGASATSVWRTFYTTQGTSINLIIDKGVKEQNWDYVGVAYAIRAWGFQQLTDYFSDAPFYEAWQPNRASFYYDPQEVIYKGIDSLLRTALVYLNRTDGKVSASGLGRGDIVYKGDRSKWIKFVYGLLARHYNRYTNKTNYLLEGYADSVIKYVDLSFASNADNFQVAFPGTKNDDTNPFGPARGNFNTAKQSRFITQLLDGTIMTGSYLNGVFVPGNAALLSNRDPRIRALLSASADTTTITASMPVLNGGFRFNILTATGANGGDFEALATGGGTPGTAAWRRRVSVVYGDSLPTNAGAALFTKGGKYVFQNTAPGTLMAYHELQFVKAEAAYRKGNKGLAYTAYLNGINAHFDFTNTYSSLSGITQPITTAQRTQYFSTAAVKSSSATLTLSDIMLQKFIGDWAWNPYESWADMRRYHYF